jgi:murein DD-endopeptidase MepM/ murein hydrolase activator NlpD
MALELRQKNNNWLIRFLLVFLFLFLFFVIPAIYFIDKRYLLCPIVYERGLIIRNDSLGEGHFGASRSGNRSHRGIDLYASVGTEVKAVKFGRVLEAGYHKGLGNYVELAHLGNLTSVYGHLSSFSVKPGQLVAQGKIIGFVGKTGNAVNSAIEPHLHFEIKMDNIPINPQEWLEEAD